MKVQKLSSGNYRVRACYTVNGKTVCKSFTACTAKQAKILAYNFLDKQKSLMSEDARLDHAIDFYIESKSNVLSPSTIRGYRILQRNAYNSIKDFKLTKLNKIVLQKWANENAKHYSGKSIKNQYGLLTAVLDLYEYTIPKINLKQIKEPKYIVPEPRELQTIIKLIENTRIEIPVLFTIMAGLRPSETMGLKWQSYNAKKRTIEISGAMVLDETNCWVEKAENKTVKSQRTLFLPAYLCDKLNAITPKRPSQRITNVNSQQVLKDFKRICRENDLKPFTIYSLRHAYASVMLAKGVKNKYAMKQMGHSTDSMLKKVYQHLYEDEQLKEVSKLNDYMNNLATVR